MLNADSIIAVPSVVAAMWGAEDHVAALGRNSSRINTGEYRRWPCMPAPMYCWQQRRTDVCGRGLGRSGHTRQKWLAAEVGDAVAVGFTSKAAIHPGQIDIIRKAFSPKDDERDWALGVLAAAKSNKGVFQCEGQMVDSPVLLHAERILFRPQISQSPLTRMTPGSSQNRRMRIRAGPTSSTVVPSLLPTMSDLVETVPKF
ncbi:HpcH/HpaI aldolase/citrate lyase family protein [Paenarthrobacter nicotinovorans]|uniref:HpcH/HpaI aldolase/citrate lyase family protein n=1 Tax=Paenarthrobacter nicotinovorans TaxID=29320 RepID=UPI000B0B33B5